jgi:hypothetical protein
MPDRRTTLDVVTAAVPILGECVIDGVVQPVVRDRLVQPKDGTRAGRAPQQPAPRKFALPDLQGLSDPIFIFSLA